MAEKKGAAPTVYVVSMGCSKNLVDSEVLMRRMEKAGCRVHFTGDIPKGSTVIVNTCGFIGDAKEESIATILDISALKSEGLVEKLIVMGCLTERFREEIAAEIPEIDKIYGKFDWDRLVSDLEESQDKPVRYERKITTPKHHAYLKIAEGCNRFCAFCAIPLITGRYKSRPIEEIESEVKSLVKEGVREFNVIAQDLSGYGVDLYGEMKLPELIERIAAVEGVKWIRLHYAYPAQFPKDILRVMRENDKVCTYLDIALQHISDNQLTAMRRHITSDETRQLLAEIRKEVPGIHIRTTLMVGFPGETDEDFAELMDFVKEQRFERMGAFAYSEEEDTYAANNLTDNVPQEVKQERQDKLMALQEEISMEIQQQKVGRELEVVVDDETDEYYIGRTQWDSPEVDPEVLIRKDKKLKVGEFYPVKVVEALPFELIAVPV